MWRRSESFCMHRILFFVLLALCSIVAKAQFYGKVVDGTNGEPIPFAAVKYIGTSEGRATDLDGNFVLPILDNYNKFVITFLGYKPVTVTVQRGQSEIRSPLKMYPDDIMLGEVVVKKSKERY